MDPSKVVFAGIGTSAVCYYRIMLPAMALGCDWVGITGKPPDRMGWATGVVQGTSKMPNWFDYEIVVLQQPNHEGWFEIINALQLQGTKVLYETDDYLHGVAQIDSHEFKAHFDDAYMKRAESMMEMCDAILCSTEYIARRYKKFGRTFVCENGLDLKRYDLEIPEHEGFNVGWAGATGHQEVVMPWLHHVMGMMRSREDMNFVSVGQEYAEVVREVVGPERGIAVPFLQVEQYPGAMTLFDVALAPAGRGPFFRGKSDLRWLEAGALGIPTIGDPLVYKKMSHGVAGMCAENSEQAIVALVRLMDDAEQRAEIGAAAKEYVTTHRSIGRTAQQWEAVFDSL